MIHHQVHQMYCKNSSASFYFDSVAKSSLLTSPFISLWKLIVEAWVDKFIRKKDCSSIEKHQFKPTYMAIPQGEVEGQIASTERHNNMVLAYI